LRKAVGSVVTSEFYIFANGTRFDGEALMAALKAQQAARHHEPEMAGIGLLAETGRHLEDRLHETALGYPCRLKRNRGDIRRDKEPRIENNATR
jgi:hypothetical protein